MKERRAELVHRGGTRFDATTGTGRVLTFGDVPDDHEHSPVELVAVAVAACSAMDVVSILEKKRQVLEDYRVHVEAIQRDPYPQVLTRIDIVHELVGPGVAELAVRRAIELSATKYCPVNAMLSAGETVVHHRYVVRGAPDAPPTAEGEVIATGPYRRPDPVG